VCGAGKRTIGGLLDDGLKSVVRYYLNNFQVRLAAAASCVIRLLGHGRLVVRMLVCPSRDLIMQAHASTTPECGCAALQAVVQAVRPVCGEACSTALTLDLASCSICVHPLLIQHCGCCCCVLALVPQDGHKQDALDLVSGAYKVKKDVKLTFQRQHSPLLPIVIALAALGYAVTSATSLASGGSAGSSSSSVSSREKTVVALGQQVVAPLLLALGLLGLVGRHGRMLVDRPQLCPQLAHTVAAAESGAAVTH
jgi:hypothetical protein